ncbi:hypothetical protein ACIQ9E_28745 [Streptomyces sp. NPDC094448]|uniref:hypothetical protein n=1 Tax=Streptomyces sp. NPDC094448 TaxID=3366063 RepID=UPI0038217AB9
MPFVPSSGYRAARPAPGAARPATGPAPSPRLLTTPAYHPCAFRTPHTLGTPHIKENA